MLQQVSILRSGRRRALARLALAMLATAAVAACDEPPKRPGAPTAPAKPPTTVTLAQVKREPLETTLKVVGTLHGEEEVTISAEVPGRVEKILHDVGDRVAPGEELARIDPSNYESAVNQSRMALNEALTKLGLTRLPEGDFDVEAVPTVERAKFEAANAEGKLDRARRLFHDTPPLLSREEFNNAETAYGVARSTYDVARLEARSQLALARSRQSEMESAQKRLQDTFVNAPSSKSVDAPASAAFAVTKRRVAGGEYVREGDPLFDLVLDDPIKLRGFVPERHLTQVSRDQAVRINVESFESDFEGKVSRINPAIDLQNRSFEIEIAVPNSDHRLRPGAFAVGRVVVGKQEAVPFVPTAAIVSFAGVDRVFSAENGRAVEHIIQPGEKRGDLTAVPQGLENVDAVIVGGNSQLSDKDPITIAVAGGS